MRDVSVKSVAVLPFFNRANNEEEDYFGAGLADEIINSLSQVPGLTVISRNSSMGFRNSDLTISEIGEELNANSILEGTFKRVDKMVHVRCKLYDVSTGSSIWSGTFMESFINFNSSQDSLSGQIVESLREHYGHFDFESLFLKKITRSEEAYEYYLKGKYHSNRWTKEDYELAITNFERAIQIDPELAQAYFELQHCYGFLWTRGWIARDKALERIKYVTVKGMSLGPTIPEAYLSMAQVELWSKWEFEDAVKKLVEGVEQYPAFVELQNTLVVAYIIIGETEKAMTHANICLALDPKNHVHYYNKARVHFAMGEFRKAIEEHERSMNMQPNFKMGFFNLFEVHLALGDQEAFDDFCQKNQFQPHIEVMKYIFKLKYASKEEKMQLEEVASSGLDGESVLLSTYKVMLQGNESLAISMLEQGVKSRFSQFSFIKKNSNFYSLKKNKAYANLIDEVFNVKIEAAPAKEKSATVVKSKRLLSDEDSNKFIEKLEKYYKEDKCFLNAALSLKDVSEIIGLHPNKLSWLVNEKYKMNFNEFTNHYRLKAFKENALKESNSHLTLLAIAYESGFSSKTSFNSFFKKVEECSPSKWLKSQN